MAAGGESRGDGVWPDNRARTYLGNCRSERGSPICSRNTIEFRNYHKYTGDAVITFDK